MNASVSEKLLSCSFLLKSPYPNRINSVDDKADDKSPDVVTVVVEGLKKHFNFHKESSSSASSTLKALFNGTVLPFSTYDSVKGCIEWKVTGANSSVYRKSDCENAWFDK